MDSGSSISQPSAIQPRIVLGRRFKASATRVIFSARDFDRFKRAIFLILTAILKFTQTTFLLPWPLFFLGTSSGIDSLPGDGSQSLSISSSKSAISRQMHRHLPRYVGFE